MKKLFIAAIALLFISCTTDEVECDFIKSKKWFETVTGRHYRVFYEGYSIQVSEETFNEVEPLTNDCVEQL